MTYAIAAPVKNEPHIRKFCEYHKNIGFNAILLGDNGLTENQLQSISDLDYVKIYDYKGRRLFQYDFYNDMIKKGEYDWYGLCDADEFFDFNELKVDQYLSLMPKLTGAVYLNWMMYGSTTISGDNLDVCIPYWTETQSYTKVLCNADAMPYCNSPHDVEIDRKYKKVDSIGKLLPNYNEIWELVPNFIGGHIRHYYYRSFESFLVKMKRGYPNSDGHRPVDEIGYNIRCQGDWTYWLYTMEAEIPNKDMIDILNNNSKIIELRTGKYLLNKVVCYLLSGTVYKLVVTCKDIDTINRLKVLEKYFKIPIVISGYEKFGL